MNFGEKVRYVREEVRKITLAELSKRCNLSVPYLSDIENNKKRPSTKSLEKIAKALNADAWFFLDDNAVTFKELTEVSGYQPPEDIMKFIANEEKLPYIALAKQLDDQGISPEDVKRLFEVIKGIVLKENDNKNKNNN